MFDWFNPAAPKRSITGRNETGNVQDCARPRPRRTGPPSTSAAAAWPMASPTP